MMHVTAPGQARLQDVNDSESFNFHSTDFESLSLSLYVSDSCKKSTTAIGLI